MRILHFALSCFYIEGYNYQENIIPRLHAQDGHQVMVMASCFSFDESGNGCMINPCRYVNEDGVEVIRLPYRRLFSNRILRRARLYPGVKNLIRKFMPDVMFFHGCSAYEIITAAKYKKRNPNVRFYIDNHADCNNSAHGFLSMNIEHKLLYRSILHRALPQIDKVLCISLEAMEFCKEVYKMPKECLEFYPLGGIILSEDERTQARRYIRNEEHITDDTIVFVHTGKMDQQKHTLELLRAFSKADGTNLCLWLIGVLKEDISEAATDIIQKDLRITYLGWKDTTELQRYLCASDIYVQPGSQSATMQQAICLGCAVILFPHRSHVPYLKQNGYFVENEADIYERIIEISKQPEIISHMSDNSLKIAHELLDYRKQAKRVLIEI